MAIWSNNLFNSRRGRILQENLTAYMLLAPAGIIIFLFGLFPVAFAFFVSLHRWRRFPDEFRGLENYTEALGNFGLVVFLWLSIGLLAYGLYSLWQYWTASHGHRLTLLHILPGMLSAVAVITLTNWFFTLLPVVLDVPRRLRGTTVTREIFIAEFMASFSFPAVLTAGSLALRVGLVTLVAALLIVAVQRLRSDSRVLFIAWRAFLALGAGGWLLRLTLREIERVILETQTQNAALPIWTQIIFISLGVGLLFAAVWLWQRAAHTPHDNHFVIKSGAVIMLIIGAYALIAQLPPALSAADDDVLQGFIVTATYSAFSVPIQLALGLLIAVLLFQKIQGRAFFRVVYFLPYITPFAASSVIFSLLFSHRSGSPANHLLAWLGLPEQTWLLEPDGIFQIIFGPSVPDFLAGPGLALAVIILYNVWVYAGYSAVIFLAGLGNIPAELYEAARIDGANGWHQFRFITVPLLSPTTFFLMLIATIGTFQAFTQVFLLRRPGAYEAVDTMNLYIYNEIRTTNPDYAYGSAMAFVLFAVILILTFLQNRVVGKRVFYG